MKYATLAVVVLAGFSPHFSNADPLVDDAMARVVAPDAKVQELASGFSFVEGPVWNPRGFWVFSDENADSLLKITPAGKTDLLRHPTSQCNGNAYDSKGRLISCEQAPARRIARKLPDGTFETLVDRYDGKRFNSPNDLVVKSDGSIYFTDPTYGVKKADVELDFRGLYRLFPDGHVVLLDKEWGQPNGLAFSPDERTLYVDDSQTGKIYSYTVGTDGALANKTLLATIPQPGVPDGMKTDARGRLYVAGPGGIWIFARRGGLLGKIPVPQTPANLAFGGVDGKTLLITARHSVYAVRLNLAAPTNRSSEFYDGIPGTQTKSTSKSADK